MGIAENIFDVLTHEITKRRNLCYGHNNSFDSGLIKGLPFRQALISTAERQSAASASRKGKGYIGKQPDFMYFKNGKETNNWVRQGCKLEKNQFCIIGIQVADPVKRTQQGWDGLDIYRYYHLKKSTNSYTLI
ncbi:16033_t:CDS:2 [Gigaspora rosea]|nr:16033_t:CDS:2 [Gigaspora rosea]